MKTNNNSRFLCLDYIAVAIIVIAFFVISYFGYFTGDDFVMDSRVSSISDVFERTKNWYFTLGGRYFSVASQYLFVGMLWNNRVWFDIMNTVFFLLLLLACGRLISNSKKGNVFYVLLFALLFWFLCPFPSQTLFWAGGSITHLWANALVFAFLALFLRYKDENCFCFCCIGVHSLCIFMWSLRGILCFPYQKFQGECYPFCGWLYIRIDDSAVCSWQL